MPEQEPSENILDPFGRRDGRPIQAGYDLLWKNGEMRYAAVFRRWDLQKRLGLSEIGPAFRISKNIERIFLPESLI